MRILEGHRSVCEVDTVPVQVRFGLREISLEAHSPHYMYQRMYMSTMDAVEPANAALQRRGERQSRVRCKRWLGGEKVWSQLFQDGIAEGPHCCDPCQECLAADRLCAMVAFTCGVVAVGAVDDVVATSNQGA